MAYRISTCLDSDKYPKCKGCPHSRPDPEGDRMACWIDEDLKGKERYEYLQRLLKEFSKQLKKLFTFFLFRVIIYVER